MKILVINWQDRKNPFSGGAEIHMHEIFGRIAKWGHDVTLFCSSFKGAPQKEIIDGIKVIRTGKRQSFNFLVPCAVQHLLNENNYDIVVDDINKIPFYTPLYVKNKPILVILHHFFGHSIYRETNPIFASYVEMSEKLVPFIYGKDIFSVVSESTKNELVKMGIPAGNIFIIHNGVSNYLYPDFTKKTTTPMVLIYGRVKKYKCPHLIFYAMKRVSLEIPGTRLVVVGEGDYLPHLIHLSKKLELSNVDFLGFVHEEEKRELLQSAWLVVNTSLKEGWSITVTEANACGTPVIASNSPGLRDSVADGKTGFLVEHGNINQLSATIIKVLKDKELRDFLSHNAIEWASKFNWDESAKQMLELIQGVMKRNNAF